MINEGLSDADRALRERITELSVHIPCGRIRGPLYGSWSARWQSCPDEDAPQKWEGCDVSSAIDLCIVCYRATAGGTSRWSWLACENCRAINDRIGTVWGFRPFALGRHSLMNGIGVRGGAPPEVQREQIEGLFNFVKNSGGLTAWRSSEYARLASKFDPLADVPLKTWQHEWPPSESASKDAFTRLFGGTYPLPPS